MNSSESSTAAQASQDAAPDLTRFQLDILTILAEEAMYGLAIKRELEDYYDGEVNHGRLYPNLDDLVEEELVVKSELDKRTNEYALTAAGEQVVFDRLEWMMGKYSVDTGRRDDVRDALFDRNGGDEA